ncbi:MAG: malonyl-CoA decarboxylase [SAR324 cluster bacterium]|nr:malonyl-CoA decarboxylase [SAR324 cluster bacterium]
MSAMSMSHLVEAIADLGRSYLEGPLNRSLLRNIENLCQSLREEKGEAAATAIAREVVNAFNAMRREEKLEFLEMLQNDFSPNPEAVLIAAKSYVRNGDIRSLRNLAQAVESPVQAFLRLLNMVPGGTETIIAMRNLVLEEIKNKPQLEFLDADFEHLLASWFNRGFLTFQRIDWNTPAVILEKLMQHEAVHEIKGWEDLRRRLADDRRCFAFFHPVLPNEPIIFIEVALTKGIAREIQPVLEMPPQHQKKDPADTAIFYSISNCQSGLKGIHFGSFLIKQVVDTISAELPKIKTYSTLSPIPGFRNWLEKVFLLKKSNELTEDELKILKEPLWFNSESNLEDLKGTLTKLCAQYLVNEKKNHRPRDPVARFHLGNGAEIEQINWLGDTSRRGMEQSAGLMVNYLYNTSHIVANHENYVNDGKIAVSSKIKKLLS